MNRFIPVAIIVGVFLGVVYLLWIVFGNVLYAPDGSITSELDELAEDNMEGEFLDNYNQFRTQDENSFGFFGVLIFVVLFLILAIFAFRHSRRGRIQ